jgi:hypothetical protein
MVKYLRHIEVDLSSKLVRCPILSNRGEGLAEDVVVSMGKYTE